LSQDTAPLNEDAFHEIQLSGKQLVFLFMATTVVSVFIFLCGVLVGRGVRAERGVEASEPAALAEPASNASATADAGAPTAEPPPAAEGDELSYHQRLQGEATPREELTRPAPEQAAVVDAAARPAAPAVATTATPARQDTWVVQLIVLRNRAEATTIVQRLTSKGYPAFVVEPAAGAAVRAFKVQVGRYTDRREAEQAARRLEKEEQFKPWILR
jgi:cell division septation protein DedD